MTVFVFACICARHLLNLMAKIRLIDVTNLILIKFEDTFSKFWMQIYRGSVAEWLARRTRDLVVAGSIPNQAMLLLPWESTLP